MNADFTRKLTIPSELKQLQPTTPLIDETFARRSAEIAKIFTGEDDRLLLIIGPCSADHEDSVLDYMTRLAKLEEKVSDKIYFIPRIYTNKPRTTGLGYKGMLHQPDPEAKPDMLKGIMTIRDLHMKAISETGFIFADEMLYCDNYKYLDDLLGYVAVGARSVENQEHRLTSSALDSPVGMKNPTAGDFSVMMNAITAAQNGHTFIYRGWEATSKGNPLAHAILRGYANKHNQSLPNYHYEDLMLVNDLYQKSGLANPAIIVDTNHANSGKNPLEQPRIAREVMASRAYNPELKKLIKGFMIESYIEDGAQKIGEGFYGKSITDACIGWEKTERMVLELADRC